MAAGKTKSLIIVESPAKAKTISAFLDSSYRVESSYGHIRDLPQSAKEIPAKLRSQEWARLGVNVDEGFEPIYVVPVDKKKHVDRLKAAFADADRLLLATDEDREGESISWHILQTIKPPSSMPVERIVFHEVTPEAIKKALQNPRQVDQDLVRAQEARRILDRLYGYSLSPLLWKRVRPGLSAGRVQSVAVRLLIDRERERMKFVSSSYWDLRARLQTGDGQLETRLLRVDGRRLAEGKSFDSATGLLADAARLHLTEPLARELARAAAASDGWKVGALEQTPFQQRPAPPFTTSTLQQEANRKLRSTSKRTMELAQQLYEGIDLRGERVGLITYMRTDSLTLSERAVAEARSVIGNAYGPEYLPEKPNQYKTKAKRAQEAHEAIRPTDLSRRPQDVKPYLTAEQHRLYELIWKRTIASQMVPADLERTSVEVVTSAVADGSGRELTFGTSGRRIVFPGFLRAYVEGTDDPEGDLGDQETLLPALRLGQGLRATHVEAEGHSTKAPYRYTEASLVKKLEEEGIGRPSTYASIISTVQDRGYVLKNGNELIPTFTAFCVNELLERQFADLVDIQFTARMEDELDEVAAGKRSWNSLVAGFYLGEAPHDGLVKRVSEGEVVYPSIAIGADPESGDKIEVKIGKYGAYLRRGDGGSENIVSLPETMAPDELTLETALDLLRSKSLEKKPIARDPASGRAIFLQKGRFGEYLELDSTEEAKQAGEKPHRVSLPRDLKAEDVTSEIAIQLIGLPKTLGKSETGETILTGIGKFGPYLRKGDEFRSLSTWQQACDLDLAEALAILAQPKPERRGRGGNTKSVLLELGTFEGAAGPVKVLEGRYGPYVSDGETHASLPKGSNPAAVTIEEAQALIEARRQAAPKTAKGAKGKKPAAKAKAAANSKPSAKAAGKPATGAAKKSSGRTKKGAAKPKS